MFPKKFLAVASVVISIGGLSLAATTFADRQDDGWIKLFNGKDLTGWTPKIKGYPSGQNFGNTFRVEDGNLVVNYEAYDKFDDRFGHLFYKTPYSNYILRLEYRIVGKQVPGGPGWAYKNSGVMIHGQTPESMRVDQDFPVSIEVQLLGGDATGERSTANLCTPGTNVVMDGKLITQHCTLSSSKTFRGEQWVKLEIIVNGNKVIDHKINGESVLTYEQAQLDENDADGKSLIKNGEKMLFGGTISLQSESHPVEFRNIELKPL